MPFELTIHEHDGPARKQVLPRKVVFFGRREDNDVVLPFTFVSSRHGRLFLRDGAVLVEDMGSTNGTEVNGQPLTPMIARPLQPEDRVQIDKIAIQARWTEEAAAGDADGVTYHEMPRPATLAPPAAAAPPPPEPSLPAPVAPGPERPLAPPAPPAPSPEREVAAQLRQTSFSDAVTTGRPRPQGEDVERDGYLVWEIVFKTVGLVAVLGGLALLIFVLVA